jgi:hypothetical protein
MSFVDLLRFKNNSTDYMSQKISKKAAKKIPKSLKVTEHLNFVNFA